MEDVAGQSDAELVERFLRAARGATDPEKAEMVGVSLRTITRWKAGDIRPLQPSVRERVEGYLLRATSAEDRSAALRVIREMRAKLDELEARLAAPEGPIPIDVRDQAELARQAAEENRIRNLQHQDQRGLPATHPPGAERKIPRRKRGHRRA